MLFLLMFFFFLSFGFVVLFVLLFVFVLGHFETAKNNWTFVCVHVFSCFFGALEMVFWELKQV